MSVGLRAVRTAETEFRFSRCIRQGGVEAPVLWGRVAKNVLWGAEEKWSKGWRSPFGGKHDNEYKFVAWNDAGRQPLSLQR